ncbi:MAG: type II secretion system protein [Phycisphaerales bacterium]|nr:MAG: hypothetical protein IPK69_07520 [Phycisphaerales bacterium]
MLSPRPHHRKALTLLELLVAVATMALLTGISAPALSGAWRVTKRTACAANLRSIALATVALADQQRQLPFAPVGTPINDISTNPRLWTCPTDHLDPAKNETSYLYAVGDGLPRDPAAAIPLLRREYHFLAANPTLGLFKEREHPKFHALNVGFDAVVRSQ